MAIKDLNEQERREVLSQVQASPPALLILHLAKEMYDAETEAVVRSGKMSDVVKEDIRFHLGIAEGMRRLLKRVNDAVQQAT